MKASNKVVGKYIPLVDFLAEVLGENTEVVLHDLINLNESVVAIRNNYISKREVGHPATDLVLKILRENKDEDINYVMNHSKSKSNKNLKSHSFFIRNESGKLVSMLCINTDQTIFNKVENVFAELTQMYKYKEADSDSISLDERNEMEIINLTLDDIIRETIDAYNLKTGINVEYLKQDDKINIIQDLYDKEIFKLKGAVVDVAKAMRASEASIYRYVQIVKRKKSKR